MFKPAVLLLISGLYSISLFAQKAKAPEKGNKTVTKDETVVIRKDKGNGRTVIEVKEGTLYVNGDPVITIHDAEAAGVQKKIIIENGDREPGSESFGFDLDDKGGMEDMFAPAPRRAMLGVLTDPKSDKEGAAVKEVTPGSPAASAGLRSGDVITGVDGKKIKDAAALVAEIGGQHEPGDKVTINYERNGKERSTTATLEASQPQVAARTFRFGPDGAFGDMPNSFFRAFPFEAMGDNSPSPKLGISAEDRADGEGVRVLDVKPGSPAASAGIKEGDVITRIGDEKIGSVDELQTNLRSLKGGEKVKLEYQREGRMATADVSLPRAAKRRDL